MDYPKITFVDDSGVLLGEDGVPRTRQFGKEWWVHLTEPWDGRVVIQGDPPLQLVSEDRINWFVPKDTSRKKPIAKAVYAPAGTISVILTDEQSNPITVSESKLEIEPANITEEELQIMLRQIGILAVSTATLLNTEILGPVPDSVGREQYAGTTQGLEAYFQSAEAILRLGKAFQQNWSFIQQRPLKKIRVETAVNRDYSHVRSPQMLIERYLSKPNALQRGLTRVSSTNCSENQFLCHILDHYLINLAEATAANLDSLIRGTIEHDGYSLRMLKNFGEHLEKKISEVNQGIEELNNRIGRAVIKLRDIADWAREARSAPFLKSIPTPREMPEITQRLLGTPGYAAVLRTFFSSQKGTLEGFVKVFALFADCWQGRVRPTWELYEIWCLAQLYESFIEKLKLRPINGRSLYDEITMRQGQIEIPRNKAFILQGKFANNGPEIEVRLYYEKILQDDTRNSQRTPDVFIELLINKTLKGTFVFDAKYRNYEEQGVQQIVEDVEGCARGKYLDPFHLTASFILHTDRNVDYWGEMPLRTKLNTPDASEDYAEHRFGAISFRPHLKPGQQISKRSEELDKQINKIFSLILQYHGEQKDICVYCARKLTVGTEIRLQPERPTTDPQEQEYIEYLLHTDLNKKLGTPLYCVCHECTKFWVIQHCVRKPEHLILKTKDICLHERSEKGDTGWWYKCPVCGRD